MVQDLITQMRTRVLEGKKVASGEKVLSLFEPHTRAIPCHKGGALVECGRHGILDEGEGGIVTRSQILEHPTEHGQAVEAVAHYQTLFEHPPGLVAGDRGVLSAETEERLLAAGVKRVAIPASGTLSEERKALERALLAPGLLVVCRHRGVHCESEVGFRLAQRCLSRARGDEAVAEPGGYCQQPAPHRSGEISKIFQKRETHPCNH